MTYYHFKFGFCRYWESIVGACSNLVRLDGKLVENNCSIMMKKMRRRSEIRLGKRNGNERQDEGEGSQEGQEGQEDEEEEEKDAEVEGETPEPGA